MGSSVDHTWVCSELDAGGSGDDVGVQGIPKRGSCLWQQWPFVDRQALWLMEIFPLEAGQTQGRRGLSGKCPGHRVQATHFASWAFVILSFACPCVV